MKQYNLYEFDGYQLIEKLLELNKGTDDFSIPIDFSSRVKKSLAGVINKVEAHNENAMFYQLEKCLENWKDTTHNDSKDSLRRWNNDILKDVLIYIDFSEVFPFREYASRKYLWKKLDEGKKDKKKGDQKSDEEKRDDEKRNKELDKEKRLKEEQEKKCEQNVSILFNKGFYIEHKYIRRKYVPFEKSASMARKSCMLFIDQSLRDKLEQRIQLGFNFSGSEISASKFYAYVGLYLSDAKRIDCPEYILNEETVIVLPDDVKNDVPVPMKVISGTASEVDKESDYQSWKIKAYSANEYKTSLNYFDGEGLISPRYCEIINDYLHKKYGMTGTAASIQIRMPFTKGMLHNVDFHKFFCEVLGIKTCEGLIIEDVYGRKRDLGKAQIILTQSMFKINNWLNNPKISSIKDNEDPLKLYFSRFHKYNHAFHVGITDMNLSQAGNTSLNYQFLNTLELKDKELDEIIEEQIKYATSENAEKIIRGVEAHKNNDKDDESSEDIVTDKETWLEVAKRNPRFLDDPKVRGMLKGYRYALLKDVGRGKLTVKGSTKFLSRDLLALLSFMIGRLETGGSVSEEQKKKIKKYIREVRLRNSRFFVADCIPGRNPFLRGSRKLRLSSNEYYGILRNPHLSRNEQCSLRPYFPKEDSIYTRYFRHLKGILMVPLHSYVPQALAGADFDGDMVKLICDKRVNRAINDECYELNTETKVHKRKLPIVMIPDSKPRLIELPESGVDFQTIKDTFSSRIGLLSNYAIYYGKQAYEAKKKTQIKCAACTLLAGVEIDAAKTGRHPDLEDFLGKNKIDYFVSQKKEIDKLPEQYMFEVEEYPETILTTGTILHHRYAACVRYGPHSGKDLVLGVFTDEYPDSFFRIDRLPYRFLKAIKDYKEPQYNKNGKSNVRFTFEKDCNWKKKLSDEKKEETVRELIYSYRKILETARNVYHIEERLKKSNYIGCINTIFKIQKKGLVDDRQLTKLYEEIYNQFLNYFDSYDSAEKGLKKLVKDYNWQFIELDEDKNAYVKELISQNEDLNESVHALYNFRWNGYFLLYYYIKDIMFYYRESEAELRIAQGEEKNNLRNYEAGYYDEFKKIYEYALAEKESKRIWQKKIISRCREILMETFNNNVDDAFMYTHKMRNCDSYGTFFWDIFTADEILQRAEGVSNAE